MANWSACEFASRRRAFASGVDRARRSRAVILPLAPQSSYPDGEGFIHDWLVLAPIAIEGESGASETDVDFLKGEAATDLRTPMLRGAVL